MKVLLKKDVVVLVPEADDEAQMLAEWKEVHAGHVLGVRVEPEATGLALYDLGLRAEACREPINVVSTSPDPVARTISNLGDTPFLLDGRLYRTIESFWQGLKFESQAERDRIAGLDGRAAWEAGTAKGYDATVTYDGRTLPVGTWAHWQLMERAVRAKFTGNADARVALLSTGTRPLTHVVKHDSRAIPGVIMAEIWMRMRRELQRSDASA
jgi:hypothetical protein